MLCLCCWAFPGLTRAPYITVWVGVWGFEAGLHGVVGGRGVWSDQKAVQY